jgi:hypothetical protein
LLGALRKYAARSTRTDAARRSAACTTSPTSSKKSNRRYRLSTGTMSPTR